MPEGSEYGVIPYEVDEITSYLETWLNDNVPGLVDDAVADAGRGLTLVRFYGRSLATYIDIDNAPKNINLDSITLPDIGASHTILSAYGGMITQGQNDVTDQDSALTAGTLQSSDDNTNWITAVENIHYYGSKNPDSNGIDIAPGFEIRGNIDIISDVAFNSTLYLRLYQVSAVTNDTRLWGCRSFVDLLVE